MQEFDEFGNPIERPAPGSPPDPNLPPEPMPEGWTPAPELPPEPMPEGWAPAPDPNLPPEPMPEAWPPGQPIPEDPTNSWGCTPRATAAVVAILAVLVLAWFALDGGGDGNDDDAALAPITSTTLPTGTSTTTTPVVAASPEGVPPDADSLPPGAVLYQGASGGPIGNIAEDGRNRFLSLDRPGLGVGDGSIAAQAITWDTPGRVTDFGVTLGATANAGRYGINLFIDGATYSVGCAIEIGETACSAVPQDLAAAAPLAAGQSLTIIVGEAGNVEASGDYPLSWWFVFQPD